MTSRGWIAPCLVVLGCGRNSSDASIDSGFDAPRADASPACQAATSALAAELYAEIGGGTVTVRLDFQTRAVKGYQVFFGKYNGVTASQAAAIATTDTGYGTGDTLLNPTGDDRVYVFYRTPGDFGGVGAVNRGNNRSVFGGSIVWGGLGDITYPQTWRDPSDLASGCSTGSLPSIRTGWNLEDGAPLPSADVDAAIAVVADTAVPSAIWAGGYVFDAAVLRYPRSVGIFDPATAEWIVMINGGWLE